MVFSTASQSEEPKSRAEEGRHGDELNYYGYSHLVDVCVCVCACLCVCTCQKCVCLSYGREVFAGGYS